MTKFYEKYRIEFKSLVKEMRIMKGRKRNIQRENIFWINWFVFIQKRIFCFIGLPSSWKWFIYLFNAFIHQVNKLCMVYMKHEHVVSMKMTDKNWISSTKTIRVSNIRGKWETLVGWNSSPNACIFTFIGIWYDLQFLLLILLFIFSIFSVFLNWRNPRKFFSKIYVHHFDGLS